MRVLSGRNQLKMTRAELIARIAEYDGADLDIGTGDGRFVLDRAEAHTGRFIVGLDPVAEAMGNAANRITRRRTRLENALFVVGSVEHMPEELNGLFENVFINLPWGSLMRGLTLADPQLLQSVAAVGRTGARYRIILNLRIFSDPVPSEVQDLPEVTTEYVEARLVPPYAAAGLAITEVRNLTGDDLQDLKTTWTRRLSHQRPPPTIEITAQHT